MANQRCRKAWPKVVLRRRKNQFPKGPPRDGWGRGWREVLEQSINTGNVGKNYERTQI